MRPVADDLDTYVRLHTDPRTYRHKPAAMYSAERCVERLSGDLDAWATEGVGYGPVIERASGDVVGWAGVRVERRHEEPHLNLYFRLAAEAIGRGLGRELARGLASWAIEHRPHQRLTAVVAVVNAASLRTCLSAGLLEVRREVHPRFPDDEPDVVLEAPALGVLSAEGLGALDVDEVIDLWARVNDAGGAVGFLPGAPRSRVQAALDEHLERVRAGAALLVTLRDAKTDAVAQPDGDAALRGVAFWQWSTEPGFRHTATLKRLMVDPAAQGRNLGRLMHAAMIGVARRELPGVELLQLDYRSGRGLGDFYGALGWTEVGRMPQGIHLGAGAYADIVDLARRVDGDPLQPDGRR